MANTEELHAKIHVMTVRIRELEVGLAALQATISEEQHPLLKKERMLNQESSPAQSSGSSPQNPTDTAGDADDEGIIEAFGASLYLLARPQGS